MVSRKPCILQHVAVQCVRVPHFRRQGVDKVCASFKKAVLRIRTGRLRKLQRGGSLDVFQRNDLLLYSRLRNRQNLIPYHPVVIQNNGINACRYLVFFHQIRFPRLNLNSIHIGIPGSTLGGLHCLNQRARRSERFHFLLRQL